MSSDEVSRRDKYTLVVLGTPVRADAAQEAEIRRMTSEQRERFARIMGGRR